MSSLTVMLSCHTSIAKHRVNIHTAALAALYELLPPRASWFQGRVFSFLRRPSTGIFGGLSGLSGPQTRL